MKRVRSKFARPLALAAALAVAALACERERKVNIAAGRRLSFQTHGTGAPAVVLECDIGETIDSWVNVQAKISRFAHVVVYDRAGIGTSGGAREPRAARQMARELRGMLQAAGIKGPYVLVGHGFGAYPVRLFASEFPSDTVGLVLLDAPHENFDDALKSIFSPAEMESIRRREAAAREKLPPGPKAEADALGLSIEQVRGAGMFPDVPLVVLAQEEPDDPRLAGLPPEKIAKANAIREDLQRNLASIVSDGRPRFTKKGKGNILSDDPDAVVAAIREAVKAARAKM